MSFVKVITFLIKDLMMKKYLIIITCVVFSVSFSQEWKSDFDKALEIAHKNNKKVLLVFQGSDWCAPCIKLEKNVWNTAEFKDFAKKHYVMLKADFPKRKKNKLSKEQQTHNNKLAEKYNKKGHFPFVVVLNNKGKVLGTTSYKKMSVTDYIKHLEKF